MGLIIYNATDFEVRLKCTIHNSGKLGFTDATAKALKLSGNGDSVLFASDENDAKQLYLIYNKTTVPGSFKINKAGAYFYVNAKGLFDKLGYNYKDQVIMFDMIECKSKEENNITGDVYELKERSKPRNTKEWKSECRRQSGIHFIQSYKNA